ncbi:chaperonin [Culex quinquefasciatus]|uniref:Chaperonin n=1 Tax=Culex quinquefasciatus TaxID=7176 RepID=B0WFV7_CULQU|nr:chaperonin [Culex quinquefasciatus]|eukprot:XP_001847591.1 chaperonin [Culex quinquefasciatus]
MFQQPNGPANVHHNSEEELRCNLEFHQQGHQMPVTCLKVAGGTVRPAAWTTRSPAAVNAARSLRAELESWPVRAAQLDVTSAKDYRKLRENEGFDDEANHLLLQQELPAVRSGRIVPRLLGLNYTLFTGTHLLSSSCFRPTRSCPVQH